jgi:ribosomal protein L11 methyltransferase
MPTNNNIHQRYYEASLYIPYNIHELACNYIIENLAKGVILEEEEDSPLIGIKFYIPESEGMAFREILANHINDMVGYSVLQPDDINIKMVVNVEWEKAYKESIKPITIDNVTVRPPWADCPLDGKIDLVIEPKMAFGTGSHETTKLCIKELSKHFRSGWSLFDLGCGSGILSILAAKLGAGKVKGVDIDIIAVQNASENIIINGVDDRVMIEFGSIEMSRNEVYDFLVANLIKSSILDLYERINRSVKSKGVIVLSGLLLQDKEAIDELLNRDDIESYEINQDGQWLAYTIFKK